MLVGLVVYGIEVSSTLVGVTALTVLVGVLCFSTVGLAATVLVASTDVALPVAYGTLLPLCFISDVFLPAGDAPGWLSTAAAVFPVKHLADALESPPSLRCMATLRSAAATSSCSSRGLPVRWSSRCSSSVGSLIPRVRASGAGSPSSSPRSHAHHRRVPRAAHEQHRGAGPSAHPRAHRGREPAGRDAAAGGGGQERRPAVAPYTWARGCRRFRGTRRGALMAGPNR